MLPIAPILILTVLSLPLTRRGANDTVVVSDRRSGAATKASAAAGACRDLLRSLFCFLPRVVVSEAKISRLEARNRRVRKIAE
jgi:hypothetical protein